MARQTWSPARSQAAFCQLIVRSLMSCCWSARCQELSWKWVCCIVSPSAIRAAKVSTALEASESTPETPTGSCFSSASYACVVDMVCRASVREETVVLQVRAATRNGNGVPCAFNSRKQGTHYSFDKACDGRCSRSRGRLGRKVLFRWASPCLALHRSNGRAGPWCGCVAGRGWVEWGAVESDLARGLGLSILLGFVANVQYNTA